MSVVRVKCPCKACACRALGRREGDRCDWCILGYHDQGLPDRWFGRPLLCSNCRLPAVGHYRGPDGRTYCPDGSLRSPQGRPTGTALPPPGEKIPADYGVAAA